MYKKCFFIITLYFFVFSFGFSQYASQEKENASLYWPLRFDVSAGEYFIAQIPFSIGLPFDFGFGFTETAPLGAFYAYGQYSRDKQILFMKQLVEKRQIKLFVGVSTDLLFEVKYDHFLSDTVNVSGVPLLNLYTSYLPVLADYHVRFIGSATNPTFSTSGFIKTGIGPYELNLFVNSLGSTSNFELLVDSGVYIMGQRPFAWSFGEIMGVGSVLYEGKEKRFNPRFILGYVPSSNTVGFAFIIHQEIPIASSTLDLGTAFVFPFSEEGYWQIRGELKHPNDHSFIFSVSPRSISFGGRWLLKLPKMF
jgi:hypothetical protein